MNWGGKNIHKMSQDVVSDALNQIMNARKVEKREVRINMISKVLVNLLEIMKKYKHIEFEVHNQGENKKKPYIIVSILKLNECKAIKPRYSVSVEEIDKYLRRFLPSRNFGVMVVSTSKGLMTHDEAVENNLGGSLIAYFY